MCGVRVEPMYNWPTCESHYELNTLYDDFYSWVWTSLYGPHGPVHVWLGGVLDCDETYAKIKDLVGPDIATNMAYYSFVHRKNLYRDGLFSCEGQAGVSTKPGDVSTLIQRSIQDSRYFAISNFRIGMTHRVSPS